LHIVLTTVDADDDLAVAHEFLYMLLVKDHILYCSIC
jgi:hypothetical protein